MYVGENVLKKGCSWAFWGGGAGGLGAGERGVGVGIGGRQTLVSEFQ